MSANPIQETPHVPLRPIASRRCVLDALTLISGSVKNQDLAAQMGSTAERYWGINEWRAAVSVATVLHDAGVTPDRYMPRRSALRPEFRYFRVADTGEEFACLASRVNEPGREGFRRFATEIKESSLTNDQLASMERNCIEAEIQRSGL